MQYDICPLPLIRESSREEKREKIHENNELRYRQTD